ncbi:MAG: hypothetical protein JWS12_684 [Candidatus Saccharibacteria bacterium]|nr:hypothetical protein [Candidatus Saccharibacteria bacterium]
MVPSEYQYGNGYIVLKDLVLAGLPQKIALLGHEFFPKSEFHISLVCVYKLAALIDPNNKPLIENQIVAEFTQFVQQHPLSTYTLTPNFRHVQRGEKQTLIVMATVAGLEDFFKTLSQKYGVELPLQPAHITLYSIKPVTGIGILSPEELARDSHQVKIAELAAYFS